MASGVWARAGGTLTSPSPSIGSRFCSLAGTVASGAPQGPPGRPRLRPAGCIPPGLALGSSQGVFPLLFALRCQPFLSPRGDASPSVLGTRPTSVAHLFCAPSTGGCILAQGIQCMHRRSPMQIPSDAYHACSCVQDPVNYWAPRGSLSFLGAQMLGPCVPPSLSSLSSEAMASGRQAFEPSGRLSLVGHGELKNVLWGTGKRLRCASS